MSDVAFHVVLSNGTRFGPAPMLTLVQWASEGRIPPEAAIEPTDGSPSTTARDVPELAAYVNAPPVRPVHTAHPQPGGGLSTLIPYRNVPALTGYYVSIASLIPGFGLILGPAAIVLGCLGLRLARRDPNAKGSVHAIIAIVLGLLGCVISYGLAAAIILS